MRWSGVKAIGLALLSGVLIQAGCVFQPLRLRDVQVLGATSEVEKTVRTWTESFSSCWLLGLVKSKEIKSWASTLPLKLDLRWKPLSMSLTVGVRSVTPAAVLRWQGEEYYLSDEGMLWSRALAARYTTTLPGGLPEIRLAEDFPMNRLDNPGEMNRVALDAHWLLALIDQVRQAPGLVATEITLRRRGGEDLILCRLRSQNGGESLLFQGRATNLDLTLNVARQLFEAGQTQGYSLLDATYDDKVFLRPAPVETTKLIPREE